MTVETPDAGPPDAAKRPRWERKAWKDMSARERATGCGGAIALLFLCGLCSQTVGNDDDSGSARPTATARATSDPSILYGTQTASAATRAAKQADTDATHAAKPTATDRPTEAPEAAAVREYMAWVAKTIAGMQPAVQGFAKNMVEAGETPAVIFTDKWKIQVAAAFLVFRTHAEEIRNRSDVPDGAATIHGLLNDLGDHLETVADEMTTGIDDFDTAAIARANVALSEVSGIITQIGEETERLAEKYPTAVP